MTWRKGRQLESLQKEDGSVLNFIYDCDGARVQKSEDSANGSTIKETRYYWNGDQLMALKDGEDLIQFTYDEKGIPFSMKIGEDVYYYLYNVQGDVVGLLDSNGVEVVSYRYSSWGKILETVDTSDNQIAARNPFRYRGYILDEETGMYYVSSRYYDPEVGRWLNADESTTITTELENFGQYNLYAYCFNNPINMKDEDGTWPKWLKKAIAVVATATVVVAATIITVATWGAGSIAGTAMISGTLIWAARTTEVIGLQVKKGKQEGKSSSQIIKNTFEAVYDNKWKIIGYVPITKLGGVAGKWLKKKLIKTKIAQTSKIKSIGGKLMPYAFAILAWGNTLYSLFSDNPIQRAKQKGYVLK